MDAATSVDVERLFSRGRLLLTHVRTRMSAETTRALLCIGHWSPFKFVKADDLQQVAGLPDLKPGEEGELEIGWDSIATVQ